jgi:hypothetical protein
MGAAGAAAVSGAGYAIQNPEKMKNAANRAGEFLRSRFQRQAPPTHPPGDAPGTPVTDPDSPFARAMRSQGVAWPPPGGLKAEPSATEETPAWTFRPTFKTVQELLETARELSETFIGKRIIESAKRAIPMLTPREIAERGLAKARGWMGDNPLLDELEKNPGEVYEAAADFVGLEGEKRAQVKQALYAIIGVAEAPAADPPEQAAGA